jgi:hypothetical protein
VKSGKRKVKSGLGGEGGAISGWCLRRFRYWSELAKAALSEKWKTKSEKWVGWRRRRYQRLVFAPVSLLVRISEGGAYIVW